MSTITKEWLQQTIAELEEERDATPGAVNEDAAMTLAAMKLALASLEAEPVEWRVAFRLDGQSGSDFEKTFEDQAKMNEIISLHERAGFSTSITPLFTATPAPVSVPDFSALDRLAGEMLNHAMNCERRVAVAYTHCAHRLAEEVRDLRAAMLHGAEPVTTAYNLPFEQWLSQQAGTIDVECGCVMTEVFFHWLRVAYEAGNSPVIPDGYALVPVEPTYQMCEAMGLPWESPRFPDRYKAMLAAAPQQEVKP